MYCFLSLFVWYVSLFLQKTGLHSCVYTTFCILLAFNIFSSLTRVLIIPRYNFSTNYHALYFSMEYNRGYL